MSSFADLLECPFAGCCLMVYGKFGQPFPARRIARLIFCAEAGELFVLHGFIKKTQKTSAVDLSLAYKRMKEIKS
ncbi:MAG: type II toxin-antitoxin system RelE/ParE family toxin [Nitrosospira sp.]|nr:type II toxin-antitoxin system RelE/ParE family toxin [Nitrosospira sp.]